MTIAVAMSGGVDSSAAAAILLDQCAPRQGGEPPVVGLTMQLWNQRRLPGLQGLEEGLEAGRASGRCCSLNDVYDARRVASFLGIPYYVLNLERVFEDAVVRPFVEQYLAGETPVPCSRCNTEIKFAEFVTRAQEIGANRIATGHYARVSRDSRTGRYRLFAAVDCAKDQSYFLFGLTQEQLSHAIFPLGDLTKEQVRAIARAKQLPVAEKPESQEICFVPAGSYRQFISAYKAENGETAAEAVGELVTSDGEVIGTHSGIHNFTVGQRKGLGLATGSPLYVTSIDAASNRVTVGQNSNLMKRRCRVRDVNWIRPIRPGEKIEVRVRIRNKHAPAPAAVASTGSGAEVSFEEPQRAITPGQAAVFYDGDEVVGGGWITSVH